MAELAFAFGGTTIIEWTRPDIRNRFSAGITGYTLMFDDLLYSISGYISGIDWDGTPYSYKAKHNLEEE